MIFLFLFLTFLKIGAFTFGGGYAMIPLIGSEVISRGWMTRGALVDFIAVSESTPGPFAVNVATFIGSEKGGVPGALCATAGVVLPSFAIILIVAVFFDRYRNSKGVRGVMSGLKPAVVGLIGAAALSVAGSVFLPDGFSWGIFKSGALYISLGVFAVAAALLFWISNSEPSTSLLILSFVTNRSFLPVRLSIGAT